MAERESAEERAPTASEKKPQACARGFCIFGGQLPAGTAAALTAAASCSTAAARSTAAALSAAAAGTTAAARPGSACRSSA
jgi:hypothetical protein